MHIKDIFTDNNNDLDIVSSCGVASFVFYIVFISYQLFAKQVFDPTAYATGAAALIASIGAGYRLKSGATPTTPQQEQQ